MTTGDWVDLLVGSQSNAMASFVALLTMISGYMVIAYTVGSKLTRLQLAIGATLYLASCLLILLGIRSSMRDSAIARDNLSDLSQEFGSYIGLEANFRIVEFVISVDFLFILAPLILMWQIRHRKPK